MCPGTPAAPRPPTHPAGAALGGGRRRETALSLTYSLVFSRTRAPPRAEPERGPESDARAARASSNYQSMLVGCRKGKLEAS